MRTQRSELQPSTSLHFYSWGEDDDQYLSFLRLLLIVSFVDGVRKKGNSNNKT